MFSTSQDRFIENCKVGNYQTLNYSLVPAQRPKEKKKLMRRSKVCSYKEFNYNDTLT